MTVEKSEPTLTCADLAAAGRWDLARCCSLCHAARDEDDAEDYDDYDTCHDLVTVEDDVGRCWEVCSSAASVIPRKKVDWELRAAQLSGLALDAGVPASTIGLAAALAKAFDEHLRGGESAKPS